MLTRPDTANRNSGANLRGNMNNTEDEGFLDNFNESHQTGSIVGSHISGSNRHFLQPPQPVANKDF